MVSLVQLVLQLLLQTYSEKLVSAFKIVHPKRSNNLTGLFCLACARRALAFFFALCYFRFLGNNSQLALGQQLCRIRQTLETSCFMILSMDCTKSLIIVKKLKLSRAYCKRSVVIMSSYITCGLLNVCIHVG
jgi:hypothetical protein